MYTLNVGDIVEVSSSGFISRNVVIEGRVVKVIHTTHADTGQQFMYYQVGDTFYDDINFKFRVLLHSPERVKRKKPKLKAIRIVAANFQLAGDDVKRVEEFYEVQQLIDNNWVIVHRTGSLKEADEYRNRIEHTLEQNKKMKKKFSIWG